MRAAEFRRRRRVAGVSGVTLHSYRYSWAQRAKSCGYPQRFAQEALGHNSRLFTKPTRKGQSSSVRFSTNTRLPLPES